MSHQCLINQPLKVPFTAIALATGRTTFTPSAVIDGTVYTLPTPTYAEIGGGLYVMTFTPSLTGTLSIFIEGTLLPYIEVVSKTDSTMIKNIEDESIGSWNWNKSTGLLTLLRQDSTTLATFTVIDTLDTASRERLT